MIYFWGTCRKVPSPPPPGGSPCESSLKSWKILRTFKQMMLPLNGSNRCFVLFCFFKYSVFVFVFFNATGKDIFRLSPAARHEVWFQSLRPHSVVNYFFNWAEWLTESSGCGRRLWWTVVPESIKTACVPQGSVRKDERRPSDAEKEI